MDLIKQTVILVLLTCASAYAFADEIRINSGDLVLNADLELAPGTTLADGVIVMLHGTLGHKDMEIMSTLQSVFEEYEYSTLAINLSFDISDRHGFYPCERPHTHEYADALNELKLWMQWLEEQDAGDIVMLGHSRGANQVANFLLQSDNKISAAILIAPSTGDGSHSEQVNGTLDQAKERAWLDDVDFLHCKSTKVRSESFLSYYAVPGQGNTPELLKNIATPVFVFSGSQDETVPGLAEKIKEVKNSLVAHMEIHGADHFFRDLFAYDVVEASIEFLKSLELIKPATSFKSDGQESIDEQRPIMIFVTQHGCQYCQLLRLQVLYPMIRGGELNAKAILREVSLDDGDSIVDFSGDSISGSEFAERYSAELTPTLLFLDGNGREVAGRIVGISNIEYYGFYMDKAIDSATSVITKSNK